MSHWTELEWVTDEKCHYVYVARRPSGLVKVGWSADPRRRMYRNDLRDAKLEFAGEVRARNHSRRLALDIEKATHRLLSPWRHKGEWYFLTVKEARETIKAVARQFRHNPRGCRLTRVRRHDPEMTGVVFVNKREDRRYKDLLKKPRRRRAAYARKNVEFIAGGVEPRKPRR